MKKLYLTITIIFLIVSFIQLLRGEVSTVPYFFATISIIFYKIECIEERIDNERSKTK